MDGPDFYVEDTVDDLEGKLAQGFMSVDELEEVDIGSNVRPRPTFVSAKLSKDFKKILIELLEEYKDCFACEYHEMLGLNRSIVEHWLPIKPGYRSYKQPPRRFKP